MTAEWVFDAKRVFSFNTCTSTKKPHLIFLKLTTRFLMPETLAAGTIGDEIVYQFITLRLYS